MTKRRRRLPSLEELDDLEAHPRDSRRADDAEAERPRVHWSESLSYARGVGETPRERQPGEPPRPQRDPSKRRGNDPRERT